MIGFFQINIDLNYKLAADSLTVEKCNNASKSLALGLSCEYVMSSTLVIDQLSLIWISKADLS